MDKANETLRERLLAMEKTDATREESINRQIEIVGSRRLSIWQRIGFACFTGLAVVLIVDFVDLVRCWGAPKGMSKTVWGTFWLVGFLAASVCTALAAYLTIRGRFPKRITPVPVAAIWTAMMFFYMVLRTFTMEFGLMWHNPQDYRIRLGEQLAVATFFMLVFIGLCLILRVVYRTESRTHEKLLRIEYRLADLAERIEGGTKPEGTARDATP